MTPEHLKGYIGHCHMGKRRGEDLPLFNAQIAGWLGYQPITLRRWLSGERPVPRHIDIIMTVLHFWPDVTAEAVDKLIQARDEGTTT